MYVWPILESQPGFRVVNELNTSTFSTLPTEPPSNWYEGILHYLSVNYKRIRHLT